MSEARVFISHTHQDVQIANALRDALRSLFGDSVSVAYSTNKEEGGIAPGDDWIQWIATQVQQSTVAMVLLTPASIQKPWVLWEAGAVAGTALAGDVSSGPDAPNRRKVRPVSYQLKASEIPAPFRHLQVVGGDTPTGASQLFESFIQEFALPIPKVTRAALQLERVVATYTATVAEALLNAPMLPTEDVVQEWCLRLDTLRTKGRASEVGHIHDWLNLSFGRERGGQPIPIDLRLHRRLGELYLESKQYARAAEEFELGRRLAPRDIFILRELGRAYLGNASYDKAMSVIKRIGELDPGAFEHNVECAAFKGRWYRDQGNNVEALAVYEAAYRANPKSYYLADLVGQMQLATGKLDQARNTYEALLQILNQLGEHNVWTYASAATASAVLGRGEDVERFLGLARSAGATAEEMNSIERGLQRVTPVAAGELRSVRAKPKARAR